MPSWAGEAVAVAAEQSITTASGGGDGDVDDDDDVVVVVVVDGVVGVGVVVLQRHLLQASVKCPFSSPSSSLLSVVSAETRLYTV